MEALNKTQKTKDVESQIILAMDVGLKRIGIAKAVRGIPLCLDPILRKNRNQAANAISTLIAESQANVLVVGIPNKETSNTPLQKRENDPISTMQKRIRHFIGLLQTSQNVEIVFFDESFSSKEALERLENKRMRKRAHSRDGTLDSLAALVILERYLMRQKQH